jgi:hypothetical protein
VLCNAVGAFSVSCDGSFWAATPVVTSNAAVMTKEDRLLMIFLLSGAF